MSSAQKIRRSLIEATEPKKHSRKPRYNSDPEDTETEEVEEPVERPRRKVRLPGGSARLPAPSTKNLLASTFCRVGDLRQQLHTADARDTYYVRHYLDVLFGSIFGEIVNMSDTSVTDSAFAIPGVVRAILSYNNLDFNAIRMYIVKTDLPEVAWYHYEAITNELTIFVQRQMYDSYCQTNGKQPVVFTSGSMPLSSYNTLEKNPYVSKLEPAHLHCAVVCDHLAQHIICDLTAQEPRPEGASIHHNWTERGTTLHSMLDITMHVEPVKKTECNNFITLLQKKSPQPFMPTLPENLDLSRLLGA